MSILQIFPWDFPMGALKIEVYPMGQWMAFPISACCPDSKAVEILKIGWVCNSLPYLHMGLRDLTSTPYNVLINSNMVLWVKCDENLWKLEQLNTFSHLNQITVLKCKIRLPKNGKNFIDPLLSKMGGSRFELSTKFWLSRCWKTSGNIW